MKKILIVEDEKAIRSFEVINLNRAGYTAVEAASAEEALEIFENEPESFAVALLDITLPGMDGFELCQKLREISTELGIIMLTARTQEMDKVSGLMMGADDYITKPFSPTELNARIDSLIRRIGVHSQKKVKAAEEIIYGDFTLDRRRRTLSKCGELVVLTHVEYQIIEYLFLNPDATLSRTEILDKVWGTDYFGDEKIVDVNIRRLRKKLEKNPSTPVHLITIWGHGYMWTP